MSHYFHLGVQARCIDGTIYVVVYVVANKERLYCFSFFGLTLFLGAGGAGGQGQFASYDLRFDGFQVASSCVTQSPPRLLFRLFY